MNRYSKQMVLLLSPQAVVTGEMERILLDVDAAHMCKGQGMCVLFHISLVGSERRLKADKLPHFESCGQDT